MTLYLNDYHVFITGGSIGMGYEMAKTLLAHGATVVIAARNSTKLEKAYGELRTISSTIYTRQVDVTSETSVQAAVDWYQSQFTHLDLLINNAGVGGNIKGLETYHQTGNFFDIPPQAFQLVVDTNFLGYFLVAKAFTPMMVKQGQGQIVYTSTSTETMTRPGMIPYGPSKSAGESMSHVMAKELAGSGVNVNIICPGGFTKTNMSTTDMIDFFKSHNLPILQPTVLNQPILFLASPAAKNITDQKIIGKDFKAYLEKHNIKFDD